MSIYFDGRGDSAVFTIQESGVSDGYQTRFRCRREGNGFVTEESPDGVNWKGYTFDFEAFSSCIKEKVVRAVKKYMEDETDLSSPELTVSHAYVLYGESEKNPDLERGMIYVFDEDDLPKIQYYAVRVAKTVKVFFVGTYTAEGIGIKKRIKDVVNGAISELWNKEKILVRSESFSSYTSGTDYDISIGALFQEWLDENKFIPKKVAESAVAMLRDMEEGELQKYDYRSIGYYTASRLSVISEELKKHGGTMEMRKGKMYLKKGEG